MFNHLPAVLQSLVALFDAELKGVVKKPEQHAQRQVIHQANYLGGIQTYIPHNDKLKTMLRNITIYNAHNRGASIENALHETITRNHCCKTMDDLLEQVEHFMDNAAPFPGGGHGLQRV